ncbi:unnamed protein product [Cyprideis torosa]|uniref:Uncharacterized protein n=1 Tax=Cyprideis torosa TaxID=163714 RepID=A0A7R8ZQZ1_9CRUS|nr:unnamed protein product [Cyprideis torosa]CAG0893094.1 unnamed protein product [Cyprideis torosa]
MMKTLLWILLVFGLSIFASNGNHLSKPEWLLELEPICPTGFFPLGRSCYAFGEDDIRNWDVSQTHCGTLAPGGRLLEMETAEEFYLITNYLRRNPPQYMSDDEEETERPLALTCPPGFFGLGESCYAIGQEYLSWDQSQIYCDALAAGGRLIEIEAAEEFYLFTTYLRDNPPPECGENYGTFRVLIYACTGKPGSQFHANDNLCTLLGYWIGAEEREDSNYFQWASSRWPLMFYNWYFTEPNFPDSGNAIALSCSADWQWYDTRKSYGHYPICEAPPIEVDHDSK